ncbi:MAG: PPE domain-containing protein, partial [Labedaea sp.]
MTGPREVPSSSVNPEAHSHEVLKAMTDAANPAAAQAVADGWSDLAAGFDEAADLFHRARTSSEPGWSGDAAEAMRAALTRVADWTRVTAAGYQAAATTITTQAEAAQSAKAAMPPPVRYDPAAMIRAAAGNPADLAALPFRLHEQKRQHDAAHAEAARVVTLRDRTLTEAAGALPGFTPPPTLASAPAQAPPPAPASPAPQQASPAPRQASTPPRTDPSAAHRAAGPAPAAMPASAAAGSPPPAPPRVAPPNPAGPVHPGGTGANRPGPFAPNRGTGPARPPNPPLPPNQSAAAWARPAGPNQPRPPGP